MKDRRDVVYYVRTKCGMVVSLEDGYYEINSEQLIDEKYGRWEIKSQGANLIDVLEEKDIYLESNGDVRSIVNIKKFKEYGKHDIAKVITHEQYMKLSQEVK